MTLRPVFIAFALFAAGGLSAVAPGSAARAEDSGVPYWASLRGKDVNMRVGPGEDYRINWRYHREHLPVKVLRVMDGWRLVQDPDGVRGWMMARFLKRERGAIVQGRQPVAMREAAAADAPVLWRLEPGVTGILGDCADGWCKFDVNGRAGYVRQEPLWGAGNP